MNCSQCGQEYGLEQKYKDEIERLKNEVKKAESWVRHEDCPNCENLRAENEKLESLAKEMALALTNLAYGIDCWDYADNKVTDRKMMDRYRVDAKACLCRYNKLMGEK